jgi:ABC-type sugar transport system substrate-binding protein
MVCRIALFLRRKDDDYQELLHEQCVASARAHNFEVRVFWADDDVAVQVRQIEQCVGERDGLRPTVLLVHPVREVALVSTAHSAARAGIGWVLLNRWSDALMDLRQEFPRLPIFSVSPDQHEVGRIQGSQFRSLLPQGGEVVYIRGPMGTSTASRRLEGVQDALQPGAIDSLGEGAGVPSARRPVRIYVVNSDWTRSGGEEAMREWMQVFHGGPYPRFVVGAQNDAMALGARSAFEAATHTAPPGEIRFTGCDGSPAVGQRMVGEGKLTATIVIPATTGRAVNEVASMVGGGPRPLADIALGVTSFPELSELMALGHADERQTSSSAKIRTAPTTRPVERATVRPAKK